MKAFINTFQQNLILAYNFVNNSWDYKQSWFVPLSVAQNVSINLTFWKFRSVSWAFWKRAIYKVINKHGAEQ